MCALLQVKFILPQGPQPSLSIVRGGGLKSTGPAHDISVRSKGQYSLIKHTEFSYVGQRNLVECSNRGLCDYDTGMCQCFKGGSHPPFVLYRSHVEFSARFRANTILNRVIVASTA
jgi:hypothetical protein